MSSSNVLKRVALFGSLYRQQPARLAFGSFSRRIPDPNSSSSPSFLYNNSRRVEVLHMSQFVKSNGKRAFPVDTLALVRRMEPQDVPSKHVKVITSEIIKSEMTRDTNLFEIKSGWQSSMEHHFSLVHRECEKLRAEIEKWSIELRYEIEKRRANNEKGHNELRYVICEWRSHVLMEIYEWRAQVELAKYQFVKYTIVSFVLMYGPVLAVDILMSMGVIG